MPQRAFSVPDAFGPVLVCLLLLVLVLSNLVQSVTGSINPAGWLASDYPDPRTQPPEACGFLSDQSTSATLSSSAGSTSNGTIWICDPDRILSLDEAILLGDFLGSLFHESPCDCDLAVECPVSSGATPTGYLIGVALVDHLNTDGMTFEPINVKAANFARETRTKWFAELGCDDNALVFYSRFSNELYISIGEKTKELVSDLELASLYSLGDSYFTVDDSSDDADGEAADTGQTVAPGNAAVFDGLQAVLGQLDEAINNGPSITSDVVFAFAIPVLLLIVLTIMCLISNLWCAQDISVPEPSQGRRSRSSEAEAAAR